MVSYDIVNSEDVQDHKGRQVTPILGNTVKDGSGTFYFPVVDSDGKLVSADTITGIGDGVKTISNAGTDEALAASTTAKAVIIQAQTDNTNKVAVGATGVDATVATGTGIILDPGDTITLPCDNLADIYVDALVSGEGVRYTYLT